MENRISKADEMKAGIYIIKSTKGDFYIGSTKCFKTRFEKHRSTFVTGNRHRGIISRYAAENGHECLSMEVLLIVPDEINMRETEYDFIKRMHPTLNVHKKQRPKTIKVKSISRGAGVTCKHPDEIKKKISLSMPNRRKVAKLLNGVEVDRFSSVRDAANSVGKRGTSHISHCCDGRRLTAYDFSWAYIS